MSEPFDWLLELLAGLDLALVSVLDSRREKLFAQVRNEGGDLSFFKCSTIPENLSVAHEARILGELSEGIAIRQERSGVTRGRSWLLLPWYTLRSAGKELGVPTPVSVKFMDSAIAFAALVEKLHGCGFLHGDLQPGHFVWVEELKAWRVIDFDCARRLGEQAPKPEGGMVHFVPPEFAADQLDGEVRAHGSGASDVYSLAATLYFLLTGKAPRKTLEAKQVGADYRALLEIVRDSPVSLFDEYGIQVPRGLEELLIRSLSNVPGDRPTCAEFTQILRYVHSERESEKSHGVSNTDRELQS